MYIRTYAFVQLNQVERLKIRLQVMIYIGNFEDDVALLSPVSNLVVHVLRTSKMNCNTWNINFKHENFPTCCVGAEKSNMYLEHLMFVHENDTIMLEVNIMHMQDQLSVFHMILG